MAPRIIKLLKGNKRKHNQGPSSPIVGVSKKEKDYVVHVPPTGLETHVPTKDRETIGPTKDRRVIGPTKGRRSYVPAR